MFYGKVLHFLRGVLRQGQRFWAEMFLTDGASQPRNYPKPGASQPRNAHRGDLRRRLLEIGNRLTMQSVVVVEKNWRFAHILLVDKLIWGGGQHQGTVWLIA